MAGRKERAIANPVEIIVVARERPIYLWACLDALYRSTKHPHRVTLIDMASCDPWVDRVIGGFVRRGFIDEVMRFERNDPRLLLRLVEDRLDRLAPWFAYVEGDAVVEGGACWLTQMTDLMHAHPGLAMLGSAIDRSDFVAPDAVAHLRRDETPHVWQTLLKAASPERDQRPETVAEPLFSPHTPAGRFLLLRTAAIRDVRLCADAELAHRLGQGGWQTATATRVRHRHLSLLHVFDEPGYDVAARDAYMAVDGTA